MIANSHKRIKTRDEKLNNIKNVHIGFCLIFLTKIINFMSF